MDQTDLLALQNLIKKYGKDVIEEVLYPVDRSEPLLNPDNYQFTALPVRYKHLHELYKLQKADDWQVESIDFSHDYDDFQTLKPEEQYFIKLILSFFAASDGIVNFNIGKRFLNDVTNREAIKTYCYQMMIEDVHSEVYALMLDNLIKDEAEKQKLFNGMKEIESVKLLSDWALKWIDSTDSFAHRLIAFALVEGVFFSGAFAAIFWIKDHVAVRDNKSRGHNFMGGLMMSNKYISRDEGQHCTFACELYKLLEKKLDKGVVYEIFDEAVEIAKHFMTEALPVRLIGMNSELMGQYIEYIADRLLVMLEYPKKYQVKNPFKFMERIGLDDKSNFFEVRAAEYQNAHVMQNVKGMQNTQEMNGTNGGNGTKEMINGNRKILLDDDF